MIWWLVPFEETVPSWVVGINRRSCTNREGGRHNKRNWPEGCNMPPERMGWALARMSRREGGRCWGNISPVRPAYGRYAHGRSESTHLIFHLHALKISPAHPRGRLVVQLSEVAQTSGGGRRGATSPYRVPMGRLQVRVPMACLI